MGRKQKIGLVIFTFALLLNVTACDSKSMENEPGKNLPSIESLYGSYCYAGPVSDISIYVNADEAPVYVIDENYITQFRRDMVLYSPWSSNGEYHGTYVQYPITELTISEDSFSLLEAAGIDTAQIQSCQRFILRENAKEFYLVDGKVWVAEQWKTETPVIYELTDATYTLGYDEFYDAVLLVDTTAPHILDISGTDVTEEDVLECIGTSSETDGKLVAYRLIPDEFCKEYTVFEFEEGNYRSRAWYSFYENEEMYLSARGGIDMVDCNDSLKLVKCVEGYEVNLRTNYRGLNYQQFKTELAENGYQII